MMNRVVSSPMPRRLCLTLALATAALLLCGEAQAQGRAVRWSMGSTVKGYRPKPTGGFSGNMSTKGNLNAHAGEWGTGAKPPAGYDGILNAIIRGFASGNSQRPGNPAEDFNSFLSDAQSEEPDGSPKSPATFAKKPPLLPKPPGPRPANLQESLQTGAVDGQVVENPFVKPSQKKAAPRATNSAR